MNQTRTSWNFWLLLLLLLAGGALIHWREAAGEIKPERKLLQEFPSKIGSWEQLGADQRFEKEVEDVLRVDDYLMRDYFSPKGKSANLYIGYHASQRTGATYHSPRNCLPGSGWTMTEPALIEIPLPNGQKFIANRYIIENNRYKSLMIYWYQGRGRFTANEYADKFFTVYDSIRLRRSDAAMVRIIASVENSETEAIQTATDLAAQTAATLPAFVPN
ncbi:MAG TPA: EpsI family protein [Pyrinomonadaceae bacterium]|nr:EpsI family protein [Pyrinomonadaceae bacterium]